MKYFREEEKGAEKKGGKNSPLTSPVPGSVYCSAILDAALCAFKSKSPLFAMPQSSPHPNGYLNSKSVVASA